MIDEETKKNMMEMKNLRKELVRNKTLHEDKNVFSTQKLVP